MQTGRIFGLATLLALGGFSVGCSENDKGGSGSSASGGTGGGGGTSSGGSSAGGTSSGGSSTGGTSSGGTSSGGSSAGGTSSGGSSAGGTSSGGSAGDSSTDGSAGAAGAAGAGAGGTTSSIEPSSTVQDVESVVCAGEAVSPNFSDMAFPCDASMSTAEIRAAFGTATLVKFLAANWASSELNGGCDQSTLCGQQFDPSLLLIAQATGLDPISAANQAGIDIDLGLEPDDVLNLGYNCLLNFPDGYSPANVPTAEPILPQDDVRTGEFLLFGENSDPVYRGRVQVTIDFLDVAASDIDSLGLTYWGEGMFKRLFLTTGGLFEELATGTGDTPSLSLGLVDPANDNLARIDFDILCMQEDPDINE